MTVRADFYQCRAPGDELRLALRIVEKAWKIGHAVTVRCRDEEHAEQVDEALWELRPDAFVPHVRIGADIRTEQVGAAVQGPALVNLSDGAAAALAADTRLVEIIPADPEQRGPSRERYRQYGERGWALNVIKL